MAFTQDGVGKHLTFLADGRELALPITRVQELISVPEITRVPGAHRVIRGVINLRGKLVMVMDARRRLALPETAYDAHACIIVVQVRSAGGLLDSRGMLVDRVLEVVDLAAEDLDTSGDSEVMSGDGPLTGVARKGDRVLALLDADSLFALPAAFKESASIRAVELAA